MEKASTAVDYSDISETAEDESEDKYKEAMAAGAPSKGKIIYSLYQTSLTLP